VVEAALDTMRKQGATIVDVRLPRWLLDGKGEYYTAVRYPEFVAQIAAYLATTGPSYPKNLDQLIERARTVNAPRPDGGGPNPSRWSLMLRESGSGTIKDFQYTSVRDHALPLVRDYLAGVLAADTLDAIVYPTDPRRPQPLSAPAGMPGGAGNSPSNLANLSGFPDLIVPAGFSTDRLPIGLSFLGGAFSEARLLAIGYSFEQATKVRRLPVHAPLRAGESIALP
jgi:amidase